MVGSHVVPQFAHCEAIPAEFFPVAGDPLLLRFSAQVEGFDSEEA